MLIIDLLDTRPYTCSTLANVRGKPRNAEGNQCPLISHGSSSLVSYFTVPSVAVYSAEYIVRGGIGNNLKGPTPDLIDVPSRIFSGGTEEKQSKPESGYPVSRPRFEPSSSRKRVSYAKPLGCTVKRRDTPECEALILQMREVRFGVGSELGESYPRNT
jgi:hypothetical protein